MSQDSISSVSVASVLTNHVTNSNDILLLEYREPTSPVLHSASYVKTAPKTSNKVWITLLSALIFTIGAFIEISGCGTTPLINPTPTKLTTPGAAIDNAGIAATQISQELTTQKAAIDKNSTDLGSATTTITKNATDGKNASIAYKNLSVFWDNILNQMPILWNIKSQNDNISGQLDGTKNQVTLLQNTLLTAKTLSDQADAQHLSDLKAKDAIITQQQDDLAKAKQALSDQLRAKLMWVIIASLGGIGICAALMVLSGGKLTTPAFAAGAGCAVVLALSLLIGETLWMLPWVLGIMLVLGAAYVAYEIFIQKKSISQVVQTVEVAKLHMPVEHRLAVFGNGPIPGYANNIQSSSTEKIVKDIRKNITKAPDAPIVAPSIKTP